MVRTPFLGKIPFFGAEVTALKFFESAGDDVELDDRVYAIKFGSLTARYINWELSLDYPLQPDGVEFVIEVVSYREDGSVEDRDTWEASVEAGWNGSYHSWGSGWEDPGNWDTGKYWVELFVDGQLIASGGFEIVSGFARIPVPTVVIPPLPTPVVVATPAPTVRPTSTPAPSLPATGLWHTARAFGSGGFQTTYIDMFGMGPSDDDQIMEPIDQDELYKLTFRCDRGREFQFTVQTLLPDNIESKYDEFPSEDITVRYATGGSLSEAETEVLQPVDEDEPRNIWWQQYDKEFDDTVYTFFASDEAVEEIMDGFEQGDSWLVVRLTRFGEEEQYEYFTEGFNEAAKPVFSGCRR